MLPKIVYFGLEMDLAGIMERYQEFTSTPATSLSFA